MGIAIEELGLDYGTATEDKIKAKYKELARVHHPDVGGNEETFRELCHTYRLALYELTKRRCARCQGTGSTWIMRGVSSVKQRCTKCTGSGHA